MKELWKYMMNIFDDPQNVCRKVKKVNHLEEYETAVETIFNDYNTLLFQMDSDMHIMWGDSGVANFFIKNDNDFDDVFYTWDCL